MEEEESLINISIFAYSHTEVLIFLPQKLIFPHNQSIKKSVDSTFKIYTESDSFPPVWYFYPSLTFLKIMAKALNFYPPFLVIYSQLLA